MRFSERLRCIASFGFGMILCATSVFAQDTNATFVAPKMTPSYMCNARNYPAEAIRNHLEGRVVIAFHVAIDGSVKNPQVTESSDYAPLDQMAIACISASKFIPATLNGQPIEATKAQIVMYCLSKSCVQKIMALPKPNLPPPSPVYPAANTPSTGATPDAPTPEG